MSSFQCGIHFRGKEMGVVIDLRVKLGEVMKTARDFMSGQW
jgi:hypothetical protein